MNEFTVFKGQNETEFQERFREKEACFSYLAHQKWSDGFRCPHCDSTKEHSCSTLYHKRCGNCELKISPSANTIFHNVKFGIEKAFLMVFKMSSATKISAEQLAKTVGVNRKTALLFQHKVRLAMQSNENYPLQVQAEVSLPKIG